MEQKKIFNLESKEQYNMARVIGGNPNGIINFNQSNHQTARQIYRNMMDRTWFPTQINISKDKNEYNKLTENEKRAYDLVLAQLITNDSIQTNQLVDKINSYITSPVVNAALVRQSAEEVGHSESYSIMAEDICQDSGRIFNMHFEDNELYLKNKAVESMYLSLYDGSDPSKEDLLLCFVANQILEELVFPGGFVVMYSLGNKMVGSAEMIREINKDESLSHVPLFAFIFKQAVNEEFDGHIPNVVKDKARDMIIKMTDAEKRWTKYASKGLLGFSDRSIDIFIESRANSVCKNLGLELIYKEEKVNPLGELLKRNLRGETDSRQNFFEANVTEYSKTGYVNDL